MDLMDMDTKKAADQGAEMALKGPNGNALRDDTTGELWTITLLGMDSQAYVQVQKEIGDRRLRGGVMKMANAPITTEEMEDEGIRMLVAVTKGWKNLIFKKEPFPFSKENATKLYKDFPFIREQVEAFIKDRANFLGN